MEERKGDWMRLDFDQLDDGHVFLGYVRFDDGIKGKNRPVVAMKDQETDEWLTLKVTARIENKRNHKYGYLVEDWEEAGFNKPSIIKCNKEDVKVLKSDNIIKKVGKLTSRDLKGLFVKTLKVRDIEYKRDLMKNQENER